MFLGDLRVSPSFCFDDNLIDLMVKKYKLARRCQTPTLSGQGMSYDKAKGLDFCLACLEQPARLADQSVEDAFAAHGRALKMANCRSPHGDGRDRPCQAECQVSWLNRQRFGFLRKFGEQIAGLMPTCTYRHPRRGTNPLQFLGPLNSLCFEVLCFWYSFGPKISLTLHPRDTTPALMWLNATA